jgi:hypothetical protein
MTFRAVWGNHWASFSQNQQCCTMFTVVTKMGEVSGEVSVPYRLLTVPA